MNFLALWNAAQPFLAIAGAVVIPASAAVATTSTPAPGSVRARIYKGIEIAALVVGKAKDTGLSQAIASGNAAAIATAGVATLESVVTASGAGGAGTTPQATAGTP